MPITSQEELDELLRQHAPPVRRRDQRRARRPACASHADRPAQESEQSQSTPALVVPPPAEGIAYTQAEVAEMCGVQLSTVRYWVSQGLSRDGSLSGCDGAPAGRLRLRTLRVPRGRIAPGALREFLEAVNRVKVRIARREG